MATQQAPGTTTNPADVAIAFALKQVGKPYVWGATGPNSFDCSGLVMASYAAAGIRLGRTTYDQIHNGKEVRRDQLMPGDIIFPNPGHEQLYVGGGKVCEAPEAGVPVRVVPIWGFWRARRVSAPGTGSGASTVTSGGTGGTFAPTGLDDTGAFSGLTDGHNWLRIGEFIAGSSLVFITLKSLG